MALVIISTALIGGACVCVLIAAIRADRRGIEEYIKKELASISAPSANIPVAKESSPSERSAILAGCVCGHGRDDHPNGWCVGRICGCGDFLSVNEAIVEGRRCSDRRAWHRERENKRKQQAHAEECLCLCGHPLARHLNGESMVVPCAHDGCDCPRFCEQAA